MSSPRRILAGIGAGSLLAGGLVVASASAAFSTTEVNFTTVGATTWTVPAGVTSVEVEAAGASGGTGGGTGGAGALLNATLTVSGGQSLALFVGGGGGASGGGGSTSVNAGTSDQIIAGGGGGGGAVAGSGGNAGGALGAGADGGGDAGGRGGNAGTGGADGGGDAGGRGGNAGTGGAAGGAGSAGGNGNGGPGGNPTGGLGPIAGSGGYGGAGVDSGGRAGGGGGGYGGGGGGGNIESGGGAGGSIGPAGVAYASSGRAAGSNGYITLTYVAPSTSATLDVTTTSLKKLPRSGKTTVVKSAVVTPTSAGTIKSIKVSCTRASSRATTRGDMRYCTSTKNLRTGKVTVRTYGVRNVKVKVTITTKPSAAGGEVLKWKQTWATK